MVAPADRRVAWHPRHTSKFAVGGGTNVASYEWSLDDESIRHVTSYDDLQHMKCFAWCPDPMLDDFLAVGLSNGKVDLVRLDTNRQAERGGILSRGPIATLSVRNPRACNTVAFSTPSPHLLACGLDKQRGDASLLVWDLNTASIKSDSIVSHTAHDRITPRSPPTGTHLVALEPRLSSQLCFQAAPAEIITATAFAPDSDQILLSGVSGRFLRAHDIRNISANAAFVFSVPCKSHHITVDALDGNRIACCGEGVVTVWDMRHMSEPALTFTSAEAASDSANPRAGVVPLVMVEFSRSRRGIMATLEKDASHVRFWDTQVTPMERREALSILRPLHSDASQTRMSRLSWTNPALSILNWGTSGPGHNELTPVPEPEPHSHRTLLVNTWKTKPTARSLMSFALIPDADKPGGHTRVLLVTKDGDLEVSVLHDSPKHVLWSTSRTLLLGNGSEFHLLDPNQTQAKSSLPEHQGADTVSRRYENSVVDGLNDLASRTTTLTKDTEHEVDQAASLDISVVMHARAAGGYSIRGMQLNATLCQSEEKEDDSLSGVWSWLAESHQILAVPEARVLGFDFALQGLLGIWEGLPSIGVVPTSDMSTLSSLPTSAAASPLVGQDTLWDTRSLTTTPTPSLLSFPSAALSERSSSLHRRRSKPHRATGSPSAAMHGNFRDAVTAVLSRQENANARDKDKYYVSWRPSVKTEKLPQRRLALALLAWNDGCADPALSTKRWEDRGEFSRAACWLVFLGDTKKAIHTLAKSKDPSHFMMSGTLAALSSFNGSLTERDELGEYCKQLIPRLADPHLRALITRLTSEQWTDVLAQPGLPFRERIAIALHFLDDAGLSAYLQRMSDECRSRGDIEGLLLTGVTSSSAADLLQTWLDRTGDIQTVAVMAAWMPLDMQIDRWTDAYRGLLDAWRMFHERVEFDMERGDILGRLQQTGISDQARWAPKTVLIRCNYCQKTLDGPDAGYDGRPTVCSNCKRQLPRCSICLLALQVMPDNARAAETARHPIECDEPLVICQMCRHGGHASHILEWFFDESGDQAHATCPVTDCSCACADDM